MVLISFYFNALIFLLLLLLFIIFLFPSYLFSSSLKVFVADRNPARPSTLGLAVDDGPMETQRSSGIIVCAGTGSSAWMANATKVHADDIARIISEVGLRGDDLPRYGTKRERGREREKERKREREREM